MALLCDKFLNLEFKLGFQRGFTLGLANPTGNPNPNPLRIREADSKFRGQCTYAVGGDQKDANVVGTDLGYSTGGAAEFNGNIKLLVEAILDFIGSLRDNASIVRSKTHVVDGICSIHQRAEARGIRKIVERLIVSSLQNIRHGGCRTVSLFIQINNKTDNIASRWSGNGVLFIKNNLVTPTHTDQRGLPTNACAFSDSLRDLADRVKDLTGGRNHCIVNILIKELVFHSRSWEATVIA